MLELFILLGLIISTVYFVLLPYTHERSHQDFNLSASTPQGKLMYQQANLQSMMEDLEFDFLTGKLDRADHEALTEEHRNQQRDLDNQMKNLGGVSRIELVQQLEAEISLYQANSLKSAPQVCPRCGYDRKANDKFCSNCGIKLN